jgi:hypothetical protein
MYEYIKTALESNLNRLNKIEFEDVFNKDMIVQGPNPHELYMRQFNWFLKNLLIQINLLKNISSINDKL